MIKKSWWVIVWPWNVDFCLEMGVSKGCSSLLTPRLIGVQQSRLTKERLTGEIWCSSLWDMGLFLEQKEGKSQRSQRPRSLDASLNQELEVIQVWLTKANCGQWVLREAAAGEAVFASLCGFPLSCDNSSYPAREISGSPCFFWVSAFSQLRRL